MRWAPGQARPLRGGRSARSGHQPRRQTGGGGGAALTRGWHSAYLGRQWCVCPSSCTSAPGGRPGRVAVSPGLTGVDACSAPLERFGWYHTIKQNMSCADVRPTMIKSVESHRHNHELMAQSAAATPPPPHHCNTANAPWAPGDFTAGRRVAFCRRGPWRPPCLTKGPPHPPKGKCSVGPCEQYNCCSAALPFVSRFPPLPASRRLGGLGGPAHGGMRGPTRPCAKAPVGGREDVRWTFMSGGTPLHFVGRTCRPSRSTARSITPTFNS